jgi:hypothetical protein
LILNEKEIRNGQRKLTKKQWEEVRALYVTGSHTAKDLAGRYGISHHTLLSRCRDERWPTQTRIVRAAERTDLSPDDPAKAQANLWLGRKHEMRESLYSGSKKALERFWATAPVPVDFAEAEKAARMLERAIDPDGGLGSTSNLNISILTSPAFKPEAVIDV